MAVLSRLGRQYEDLCIVGIVPVAEACDLVAALTGKHKQANNLAEISFDLKGGLPDRD